MKFSFMSFSCPELSLDQMLSLAKKLGYDGVEPRISAKHQHGVEFEAGARLRAECKAKAEAAGIAYSCVATSCRYADPETNATMTQDTHKAIDLAADIGCSRIRVFGGSIPSDVTREEATDLLVSAMNAVSAHAAERGVLVCMETHDHWCNPEDLAVVMKTVDHPNIAVNWDIMHPVRVAKVTMDEAFQALKPWIRHIHCHDGVTEDDGKLTLCPIGEGIVDHARAVELLQSIDYDGYMSGEWINWEPAEKHLPRELARLKALV